MSSQAANQIAQKQAYLRDNISPELHEDFGEFCESYAGNVDIENWTFDYVKTLVAVFHEQRSNTKTNNPPHLKQSYHMYQTGNAAEIGELSQQIKAESKQAASKAALQPQINEPIMDYNTLTKNAARNTGTGTRGDSGRMNALQVLDSVFEKEEDRSKAQKQPVFQKSFFQSNNFWNVPVPEANNFSKTANFFATESSGEKYIDSHAFDKAFQTGTGIQMAKKPEEQTHNVSMKKQVAPAATIEPTLTFDQLTAILSTKGNASQSANTSPNREFHQVVRAAEKPKQPKKAETEQQRDYPKTNVSIDCEMSSSQVTSKGEQMNRTKSVRVISVKDLTAAEISKIKLPAQGAVVIKSKFVDKVECFKSVERQAMSNKHLSVSIVNHDIITRRFFLNSNYVMYHLNVQPTNIVCKRNYDDFLKLRANLANVYPGVRLPYLEKSTGFLEDETAPANIEKQTKFLDYFIKDLIHNPELKNSRLVEDFLTVKDHKSIKRKFEEYERIKKVIAIEELCLLDGRVNVEISEPKRVYCHQMEKFVAKMEDNFEAQRKINEQVSACHDQLHSLYHSISKLCQTMQADLRSFNQRVPSGEIDELDGQFRKWGYLAEENAEFNKFSHGLLSKIEVPFLKYEKENMHVLLESISVRNYLTKQYLKRCQSEPASSESYSSPSLKAYKTEVLEESDNLTVLKYQTGYMNSLVCSETHDYYAFLAEKIRVLVDQLANKKIKRFTEGLNACATLLDK